MKTILAFCREVMADKKNPQNREIKKTFFELNKLLDQSHQSGVSTKHNSQ